MDHSIIVIDYGMGNVQSVANGLKSIGAESMLSGDPADIEGASGIILPGVGGFPECMNALNAAELAEPIKEAIARGVPYLGICLGLQVLFEASEEFGATPGLGVLPGRIMKFPEGARELGADRDIRIPHMGWNQVDIECPSPILDGVKNGQHFYFVPSYSAELSNSNRPFVAATCAYGLPFIAAVRRDNLFATQFHPEKSGSRGLGILKRFAGICG